MASSVKLLLVAYEDAFRLDAHPEVGPLLRSGWTVAASTHRIVEPGLPRLLLTLLRTDGA